MIPDLGCDLPGGGYEDENEWLTDEVRFEMRYRLFARREEGDDIVSRCYLAST
jgi:hypothetical protein